MAAYYGVTFADSRNDSLEHFGIKGQKWGIRRFQNEDGTLTAEGKKRYGVDDENIKRLLENAEAKKDLVNRRLYNKQTQTGIGKYFGVHRAERAAKKAAKNYDEMKKIADKVGVKSDRDIENEAENKAFEAEWKSRAKKLDGLMNLPKGKDRDTKLEKFLHDYTQDDDSAYNGVLVDKMIEKSGDFLSGQSKTEAHRQASSELRSCWQKERDISANIQKQAEKSTRNYSKQQELRKQLEANSSELKNARTASEKAMKKLAETILKDMDMPINENTLEYARYLIIWN